MTNYYLQLSQDVESYSRVEEDKVVMQLEWMLNDFIFSFGAQYKSLRHHLHIIW